MNTLRSFLILFAILASCSNDDFNNRLPECTEQDQLAFVDRAVIATFTDIKGTVEDDACNSSFILTGSPGVEGTTFNANLFACNLPDSFKEDGLEVIYSGNIYEIFDVENRCSQFFLLTKIETQ